MESIISMNHKNWGIQYMLKENFKYNGVRRRFSFRKHHLSHQTCTCINTKHVAYPPEWWQQLTRLNTCTKITHYSKHVMWSIIIHKAVNLSHYPSFINTYVWPTYMWIAGYDPDIWYMGYKCRLQQYMYHIIITWKQLWTTQRNIYCLRYWS